MLKSQQPTAKPAQLDAIQGRIEQRTEPYMKYGDGVAQILTQ